MALINWVKKIEKARNKLDLPADEQVLAACVVVPPNYIKAGAVRGTGAISAGMAMAERDQANATTEGIAEQVIVNGSRFALVLTDRRLLQVALGAMSGNPKALAVAWDRGEVQGIAVGAKATAVPLTITFVDGSVANLDGAKGTDPGSLAL